MGYITANHLHGVVEARMGDPNLEAGTQDIMILRCPGRWGGRLSLEVSTWSSRSNSILDQGRKVGMMVG